MKPDFQVAGVIGEGDATALALGRCLDALPGQPVRITVNSPGGLASEGAAMLALIEDHGSVHVEVMGIAASAASLLLVGASRIAMHSAALMMIHDPGALVFGTAAVLREEARTLDKMAEVYASAYARHTGHPIARIRAWMEAETWLSAADALALNFCDEVTGVGERAKAVAHFDYTRFKAAPARLINLSRKHARQAAAPAPAFVGA